MGQRKLKYRVEYSASQGNYHLQVLDENGESRYPANTNGFVTLLDSATDAEFKRFEKFVKKTNGSDTNVSEKTMLYISELYRQAVPDVKSVKISALVYYVIPIGKLRFLCIDKNGLSNIYQIGSIIDDYNNSFVFEDSTYDINNSPLSGTYLFEYWLDGVILNGRY